MNNIMYIVVNKDLNMSPGKISAQVAHAVYDYIWNELIKLHKDDTFDFDEKFYRYEVFLTDFKVNGDTICVLKASEKELRKLQQQGYTSVIDRGYTEIPKDSITAVNLGIYNRERANEIPKFIRRLRLL